MNRSPSAKNAGQKPRSAPWGVVLTGGLAIACLLIALFPLRIALDLAGAARMGLNARAVGGTLWWGGLGEARIGTVPLGTLETRFAPAALFGGELALDLAPYGTGATRLNARMTLGPAGWGLKNLRGEQSAQWLAPLLPVPVDGLTYKNAAIVFGHSGCVHASGTVEASLPATTAPVIGRLACRGKRLTLRFDLPEKQTLTLVWDGKGLKLLRPGDDLSRP